MKKFKIVTEIDEYKNFDETKEYVLNKIKNGYIILLGNMLFFEHNFYQPNTQYANDFEIIAGKKHNFGLCKPTDELSHYIEYDESQAPNHKLFGCTYENNRILNILHEEKDFEKVINKTLKKL